jgi:1-acyl-sn-glycerol-3-phosphate acyltransferase
MMLSVLGVWGRSIGLAVCFFFFWIFAFILSWVILPLVLLPLRGRSTVERNHKAMDIVAAWFRLFIASIRASRLMRFKPRDLDLDLPSGPFVMIANHPTLIDVTAIMAAHPRIHCVAKTELFRSPLVGPLLRSCGHIEGGNVVSMEGAAVIQGALERLSKGIPVLIFPEGTRSPPRGLRRFKRGVFEIAIRANAPVVPLLITCDPPSMLKGQAWYTAPKVDAHYGIRQIGTCSAGSYGKNAREAAAFFQTLYQSELDSWWAARPAATGAKRSSSPAEASALPGIR